MTLHVCTTSDMTAEEPKEPFGDWTARDLAVGAVDMAVRTAWYQIGCKSMRELAVLLAYGHAHGRMTNRTRKLMDIDKMVSIWTETLIGLSTHHSHAEYTAADHETDELLGPLLTAPIKQVREFATKLGSALEADERVPFMVWSGFRRIILPLMEKSKDGEVIELKKQLAAEVAEMAERGLDRAELVQAIAGALQWRSPSSLEKVKGALASGEKPRIRGRESCLFLEAGGEMVVL